MIVIVPERFESPWFYDVAPGATCIVSPACNPPGRIKDRIKNHVAPGATRRLRLSATQLLERCRGSGSAPRSSRSDVAFVRHVAPGATPGGTITNTAEGLRSSKEYKIFDVFPISFDNVFDQLATAPRVVLDKPKLGIGSFTDVEIILIILPKLFFLILVNS